jgi:hypothetical protein
MNMRRLQFLLFVLIVSSLAAFGQGNVMIQSFDKPLPDTSVIGWTSMEGGSSLVITTDSLDKMQGTASIDVKAHLAALHGWGTYTQFGVTLPTTATPWDISSSDSMSIWIKVRNAPTHPEYMVFRIEFGDQPTPADPKEMYIYENATILDGVHDWVQLRIPLYERPQNAGGTLVPDSTGFILVPTGWGGFTYNNKTFDRNKIVEWNLAIVTSGWDPSNPLPADSMEVSFDGFERFGFRAFPVILFSGKDFPAYYSTWTWGGSTLSVIKNAGTVPGENAIKWTQGDDYGNGWTGWGGNLPTLNMGGAWMKDSLKMWIKADSCGPLRAQFESSSGKRGFVFQPTQDGQWHQYISPMRTMTPVDTSGGRFQSFDSTMITTFGIMADADLVHSGRLGRVIWLTDIWTGSPTIDVIPPNPPTNLSALGGGYTNLLTWDPVPNEPGVQYNVYFADHAWTDPADPTVEDIPPYGLTSTLANHLLRAPNTDQNTPPYYYGVTAKDAAGNISTATVTATPTTTLAKGVPTISLTPPATFVADGNLTEWTGVTPFNLSIISGTAHDVPNFRITGGDADLSVKAYLAVDAKFLYVAFDVTDDHVCADTTGTNGNDYEQDCPDLFIGLYDWRGPHHAGLVGGATPDYHIRFSKNRIRFDQGGGTVIYHYGTPNYAWIEKILTSGYVVEARIPWDTLAAAVTGRHDAVFSPKEGMRIPMDFAINDRDVLTNTTAPDKRHAIMCYSEISFDNSYQDMWRWTNTWIGNKWTVGVKQTSDVARKYALEQNYPNPFNPSTQIRYSLEKSSMVHLNVFDLLGREVATLVNSQQEAGSYSVTFDAAKAGRTLASGVYFYRLEAGQFVATHKMMVLK